MPNFYIDIIDTLNDDLTTVLENASKNSIVLRYNGKDTLDDLILVGSSLFFEILVPRANNTDAALIHLFTGDENRWKIELRTEDDDALVWNGFLLPDSYDEPYKSGVLPIGLEATDGLGRLKGKYLSEDFYTEEKNVIDIISSCLQLTGLSMPLVFAPAIENRTQKAWHTIYLDGTNFVSRGKTQDAYTILSSLTENLVSVVYQHLGQWYFEGLNKRSLVSYSARLYSASGEFLNTKTITKIIRDVNGSLLATPNVTTVPPYGLITVNTEQNSIALSDAISKEENDGWTPAIGVVEEIYATEWYYSDGFYAKAKAPDYNVYMESTETDTDLSNKTIQLRERVYIKQNTKVKIEFEFLINYFGTENSNDIDNRIADGRWDDPFEYKIYIGSTLLYTNVTGLGAFVKQVSFVSDKTASLSFEFIAAESGLLNIVFQQPFVDISDTKISGIFITNLDLQEVGFIEDAFYVNALSSDFTVTKDLDLEYTDDASGMSKAFRMSKLNEVLITHYNSIAIPILDAFTQNGKFYCVVQLDGANLIADNIDSVYYNLALVQVNDVVYNYNSGEQMVIETSTQITSGVLRVLQYKIKGFDLDRSNWEQWTDSVYEVESKRYGNAVLGVYTRLFDVAYPKVDATAEKLPVLFADLVTWNYIEESLFIPTYVEINFDSGDTSLRLSKSNYLVNIDEVPPFVDCGPDLFLTGDGSSTLINATAYAPSSSIDSYVWSQLSGDTTSVLSPGDTEDVEATNLTGNAYEMQLTVTNGFGLSASDTVLITRIIDYTAALQLVSTNVISDTGVYKEVIQLYRVIVTPVLPISQTITFTAQLNLNTINTSVVESSVYYSMAKATVFKNNNELQSYIRENGDDGNIDFNINYIEGDEIEIELHVRVEDIGDIVDVDVSARAECVLAFGTILNNLGAVLGLPISQELYRETT